MIWLFIAIFDISLIQNFLIRYIGIFGFWDELLTLILLSIAIFICLKYSKKIKFTKNEMVFFYMYIIFMLIGVISTLIYNIQPQKIAIYKDMIAISKFPIIFISCLVIGKVIDKEYLYNKIYKRATIYINIIFIFSLINIFIDIGMGLDIRYGFRSFKFIYAHPTYLVANTIILLSIILAKNNNKNKIKQVIKGGIILVLTFRNKAFIYILILAVLILFGKKIRKIKVYHILIFGVLGIIATKEKICQYLSWGLTAARPALYIVGIDIARSLFPLGSGFGTFASSLSGKYYSPLYYTYGLSHVWGMTPEKYDYIGDTFWPYIYGQFGIMGFVVFCFMLFNIFKIIKSNYLCNYNKYISAMLLFIYLLISSTAEAVFTDVTGVFILTVIALYLGNTQNITYKIINDNS